MIKSKYSIDDNNLRLAVSKSLNFDEVLRNLGWPNWGSLESKMIKYIKENDISISHFRRIAWNKGKHLSKEYRRRISLSLQGKVTGKASTEEKEILRKKRISKSMKNNPKSGGLRIGSGRGKSVWYYSSIAGKVYLRSSYELEYAKWLDRNKISWKQNLIKFPYTFENKLRYYYPDFHLIDSNEYVEIKGYKTNKDEAKWSQFPFKLKILMREDLLKIGCNVI